MYYDPCSVTVFIITPAFTLRIVICWLKGVSVCMYNMVITSYRVRMVKERTLVLFVIQIWVFFPFFKIGLFNFQSFYTFWSALLCQMWFIFPRIFSFHPLKGEQKLLIQVIFSWSVFFIYVSCFWCIIVSENSSLNQGHKDSSFHPEVLDFEVHFDSPSLWVNFCIWYKVWFGFGC